MKSRCNFFIVNVFLSGLFLFLVTSCNNSPKDKKTDEKKPAAKEVAVDEKKASLAPGMTPWDFPTVDIKANVGDYVLCPGFKMYQKSLNSDDPKTDTYIFYTSKMSKTGDVESDIDFTFDGVQKMPNSMLIPIPSGQTAAKGDILLTWWQTGSGMQRAIVTDDSDPKQPKVRYLGLNIKSTQKDFKLKPNSFVKITDAWQPGNLIAAKKGGSYVSAQIIRVAGDKVLTIGFAGKIRVYAKADCKVVPIVPNVKKGDKVWATFVGNFKQYEVTKVDKKLGKVYVNQFNKEVAIPYGEVAVNL